MSKIIRAVYTLKHTLFAPQGFRRGLFEPSSQICNFSSKGVSKGKRKSKSRGNVSGDGNMSKQDLALQQTVPVVSTGSFSLDMALGIGGLPKGHIVEIYGPEASGKTSLALHIIAEAQKQGGYSAFIDAEHALDPALAKTCGVNIDSLLLSRPDSGEQALSLVDTLIRSQSVDVVVVDSVAGLVPKDELDGEMGDAHMAMQSRLMKQALSKLSHSVSLSQTILVFINQLRAKFSTFGRSGGPTEVTLGGNALKFHASVRLDIRRIGSVERGGEIIGNQVQVKIVKNNYAPPCRTVQFELIFGKGICRESEIADLAIQLKFVQKSEGSEYYSFNDQKFLSKDAFERYLAANNDILEELAAKLRQKLLDSDPEKEPTNEA